MDPFDRLYSAAHEHLGLNGRQASIVAGTLLERDPERIWSAAELLACALSLGYDVKRPELTPEDALRQALEPNELTLDPATILSEVYENQPRVLCSNMPRIGRAPEELQQLAPELVAELPDEICALLVKVDMYEGKATFWLRDEANDIDRPIGPIDLKRFADEGAMREAFLTLLKRLSKVLAADFN